MSNLKHTPGPWRYEKFSPVDTALDIVIESEGVAIIGWIYRNKEADAHLIAAAPEMLEALIELVEISNKYHGDADNTRLFTRALITGVVMGIIESATGMPIEEVLK